MNKSIFEEYNISEELNNAISALGFEEATPIQAQAIPLMLQGRDLIGQAQTGTGKTIAFGVPVIEAIDSHSKLTQAIVLCPTRELAIQVAEEFGLLLKFKKTVHVVPIYGGQPIERQMQALRKGAQIIIATPGRLIDHLHRKTINLSQVKVVVLDEADVMLDMGFREDIEIILKTTPKEKQTVLFSATMPKVILELTKRYLKNPEFIKVVHKELTVPSINQYYVEIKPGMKLEGLSRMLDLYNPKLSLVFCNTKRGVDDLVKHLHTRGYLAEALHGDLKQNQRDKVMKKFRTGQIDILVATDVAARGIDVDEIDAVFNYDMPQDEEYYVHRIGRTARAGRVGESYTFVTGKEIYKIRDIERFTKTKIISKSLPKAEDVAEKKSAGFIEKIKHAIGDGKGLEKFEVFVQQLIDEDFTTLEIATGLMKLMMKNENTAAASTPIISKHVSEKSHSHTNSHLDSRSHSHSHEQSRNGSGNSERLFMNLGKKSKMSQRDLLRLFTEQAGIPEKKVIEVDMYDKFSFVEVDSAYVEKAISAIDGTSIKGKRIAIEVAKSR
jgi:ATP-dependent RNA helicase DeaD